QGDYCADNPATWGSVERSQFYGKDCGTSFSAPAVTGIAALVLEQLQKTVTGLLNPPQPLPSTLRAVLLHSADDKQGAYFTNIDAKVKAYEGPDFVTGWGLVNAAAAVEIVADNRVRESKLDATCDNKTFDFDV